MVDGSCESWNLTLRSLVVVVDTVLLVVDGGPCASGAGMGTATLRASPKFDALEEARPRPANSTGSVLLRTQHWTLMESIALCTKKLKMVPEILTDLSWSFVGVDQSNLRLLVRLMALDGHLPALFANSHDRSEHRAGRLELGRVVSHAGDRRTQVVDGTKPPLAVNMMAKSMILAEYLPD